MLKFATTLTGDNEYAIVGWGQSNANPKGTWAEGLAENPQLTLASPGRALTDVRVTVGTGTETITVKTTLTTDQWVGAELRLGSVTVPLAGYGTISDNTTSTDTFTSVDATEWTANRLTATAHGLTNGQLVTVSSTGTLPGGLAASTSYFVVSSAADTFSLSATSGGAAVDITSAGVGTHTVSLSTITVTWVTTHGDAAANTTNANAYVCFRDDRHKSYTNVRVLTPYIPEGVGPTNGAYPSGSPIAAGYTFPSSLTSYQNAALFLPLTFLEGVASYGFCEATHADYVPSAANSTTFTLTGTPLTVNAVAGGYIRVYSAAGVSWSPITSNTNQVLTVPSWLGAGTPTSVASATYEVWLPHYGNNPYHYSPGKGFRYPNHYHQPQGTLLNRPRAVTTAAYPERFGVLLPLAWRLANQLGKRVNVIWLAGDASSIYRAGTLMGGPDTIGWWTSAIHLDWMPNASDGLAARLQALVETMAEAALTAESNTKPLKVLGLVGFQGEAEAGNETGRSLYKHLLPTFYRWLTKLIDADDLSFYDKDGKMPFMHASLPSYPWEEDIPALGYEGDEDGLVNEAIADFTSKAEFGCTIDTNDSEQGSDIIHFSGVGEAQNGLLAADALLGEIDKAVSSEDDWSDPHLVELCNLALSYIGENGAFTTLDPVDETGVLAAHCRRFFGLSRNMLLQRCSWSFATRREALSPVTDYHDDEWPFAYGVPSNCVRMFAVLPPDSGGDYGMRATTERRTADGTIFPNEAASLYTPQQFTVENDTDGYPIVYSQIEDAVGRFNVLVSDVQQYSPLFKNALVWTLASMLAGVVMKGDVGAKQAQMCLQMAEGFLSEAKSQDAIQREIKPEQSVPWIAGR